MLRIVSDASCSFLPQGEHKGVIEDHCLLLALDAVLTGMSALGYGTVCLCPLSSVHSYCCSVSSLRRSLPPSWWEGEYVALAHILAVLLLRGSCPSVPRRLPPGLCGGSTGPGFTRACSPRHISAYWLETGPWAMLPRSFSYHPPASHGMSRLEVRVCLHILKCLYYFLEILDYISSEPLVLS